MPKSITAHRLQCFHTVKIFPFSWLHIYHVAATQKNTFRSFFFSAFIRPLHFLDKVYHALEAKNAGCIRIVKRIKKCEKNPLNTEKDGTFIDEQNLEKPLVY